MKKTILTGLFAAGILFTASAQTGARVIGRAGVNFTNITGKDFEGDKDNGKLKTGFHIGADVEIPLADEFFIQPGVLFSTKGAKSDDSEDATTINLSYVEIPVSFIYKPVLGNGRLILGAGPYAGVAVGGKVKFDGDADSDIEFENKVSAEDYANSDNLILRRLDFGANIMAGYEMASGLSIQLNSQFGLANLHPDITGLPSGFKQPKANNTGFGVSVGYRF